MIDDDPAVREVVRRFLVKEGFRVVTAAGGEEGLRLACDLQPDAITLDVMMPGLDGWAVLAALKGDGATAAIPVVMLTMLDDRSLGDRPRGRRLPHEADRPRAPGWPRSPRTVASCRCWSWTTTPMCARFCAACWSGRATRWPRPTTAAPALERMREGPPGAILLDLMMPEMDGFEFLEELRRDEAGRGIPVVVITARELSAEDHRRFNGSVERILQKGGVWPRRPAGRGAAPGGRVGGPAAGGLDLNRRGSTATCRSGSPYLQCRHMTTKTRIVKIGNSRGIRVPKVLLDQAQLPDEVELHAEPGRLVVQATRRPRSDWAKAARLMRDRGT